MSGDVVTIERQIACVRDEVSLRRRVYAGWIRNGRMTEEQAQRRIGEMMAVQATLEEIRDARKARREPELF